MPEWRPKKKLGAAAAIFDEHEQVLLVKQSYGRLNWELPGGGEEAVVWSIRYDGWATVR